MKSVLISIKPQWCELIAQGAKTVEIRKTRPKIETPFKVYIYCTKPKQKLIDIIRDGDYIYGEIYHGKTAFIKIEDCSVCDMFGKRQKVIGEFVCYDISTYCTEFYSQKQQPIFEAVYQFNEEQEVYEAVLTNDGERETRFAKETCLSLEDFRNYLGIGENQFYGWHISDLVIYDEPRELGEFSSSSTKQPLTRPPQSWCYVTEKECKQNG